MLKKITKTYVRSLFLCIILVGIGVFLFLADRERRQVKLTSNNVHIVLSEENWTKDNYELTIKYDGFASSHIKGYSFDGGKTWSKRNIYLVTDNQKLEIAVKDINDKIYSIDYEITNIDREGPNIEIVDNIQFGQNTVVTSADLEKYVTVTDSGSGVRDAVVFTPNKVDTTRLGEQQIQIYAIDKNANKTIKVMNVNVVKGTPIVEITKLNLEKTSLTMNVNEENQLIAQFEPKYASASTIKWRSSNPSVVAVTQAGKIVAKSEGEATITAQAGENQATCVITVK